MFDISKHGNRSTTDRKDFSQTFNGECSMIPKSEADFIITDQENGKCIFTITSIKNKNKVLTVQKKISEK